MHKIQIAEESINPYSNSNANHSQISVNNMNANKKSKPKDKQKDPQNYKQNLSKHLNSIKPYIANPSSLNKQKERERKISKRQSQKYISNLAPYQPNNNETTNMTSISSGKIKNKKNSQKHFQQNSALMMAKPKNIQDLFNELVTIKGEYKSLKNSYNSLVKQNSELTQRAQRLEREISPGKLGNGPNIFYQYSQLQKKYKQTQNQSERYKNNIVFLESQNDRIKKQSLRMIENEKFRNKKLQETLQQKQLMIAYLRSQLSVLNGQTSLSVNGNGFFFQNTAPTYLKPSLNINQMISKSKIENNGSFQRNNEHNLIQNISSINIIDQNKKQIGKTDQMMPSYKANRNNINQSLMNNSNSLVEEIIDLPRQININKRNIGNALNHKINPSNETHLTNLNKRQYIFSNEEDSLSFSYEKSRSKESISMSIDQVYQQYQEKKQQNQLDKLSINSINDHPSILTFTKKDLYILEDQQMINQDKKNGNNRRKQNKIKETNTQRREKKKKKERTDRKIEEKGHKNSLLVSQKSHINVSVIGNTSVLKSDKVDDRQVFNKKISGKDHENEQWEISHSSEQKQQQIESQGDGISNNHTHTNTNQEKSSYTGEEQLLTFQNRRQYIAPSYHTNTGQIINPLLNGRIKGRKNMVNKVKQKVNQKQKEVVNTVETKQKKQIPSKSKLLTKRLEINTDDIDLVNHQGKDSSAQTRKRPHYKEKQVSNSSKTGKKKLSRKRKSQQFGSNSRK